MGKKDKKRKRKSELPNMLIKIDNADKEWHEKWSNQRNMLNFPHPFRCVIFGNPNTAKTTKCKNIILRAQPKFKKIYVVHIDGDYTKEYDDVKADILKEIPSPNDKIFTGKEKILVILEDLEYKFLNKKELRNLDRLFGYVSTHKNVSCISIAQDGFNIPPCIRRMSNIWVLGPSNDKDSIKQISRKCGLTSKFVENIYKNHITDNFKSLWIDNTKDTPYPLRLNGFEVLKNTILE